MKGYIGKSTARPVALGATLFLVVLVMTALSGAQDVVNKKFLVASAVNAAAVSFDAYTTAKSVSRKDDCYEAGAPGLLGRFPGPGRIAAVSLGEFAATEGVGYLLKKHRRLRASWLAPIAYQAAIHLYGGIHNFNGCQ